MSVSLVKVDRATNATYFWLHTLPERCRVVKVTGGRAYVCWPMSARTVADYERGVFVTGVRPASWVDTSRLALDSEVLAGS